jgi:hypothetical protein
VLNEQTSKTILDAIKVGTPLHTAAAVAGVSDETLRVWRRLGEKAQAVPPGRRSPTERRLVRFLGALDAAMALASARAQAVVFDTFTQVEDRALAFRAACWHLEHRERADYAPRSEVTGAEGGPVEMSGGEAWDILTGLVRKYAEPEDERD